MKKILIIGILLAALFIVACGTDGQEETAVKVPVKEAPTKTTTDTPAKVSPPVEQEAEEVAPAIPSDLQGIFDRSSKIKSVYYDYREGRDITLPTWRVSIKGDKMKIGLPMQDDILYKNNIDTVILNTATRTGQGYCQSQRFCEKTGEQGEVNFDDYYRLTPFDWKNDIQSAKQVGTERKDGRDLLLVEVNGDYTFVIDKFFGVPLKIIQGKEEKYVYDNVDFNTVVDSDFEFKLTDRDY